MTSIVLERNRASSSSVRLLSVLPTTARRGCIAQRRTSSMSGACAHVRLVNVRGSRNLPRLSKSKTTLTFLVDNCFTVACVRACVLVRGCDASTETVILQRGAHARRPGVGNSNTKKNHCLNLARNAIS